MEMSQNLICKQCGRFCFTFSEFGCSNELCPYGKSLGPLRFNEYVDIDRRKSMKNSLIFEEMMNTKWENVFK